MLEKRTPKNYKHRPFKYGNSYYRRWLYSAKACYNTCRWMWHLMVQGYGDLTRPHIINWNQACLCLLCCVVCMHVSVYRVIQEESAILWEMIVCVILSKKVHTNMGPILNGYRDMVKRRYRPSSEHDRNYVINNITTNITCIVIRRVNHHVLLMWKTVSERL